MENLSVHSFRQMISYGADALIRYEQELNKINVFPVADGDTGTNMAYLMRSIIQAINSSEEHSFLHRVKLACLKGSRGNSGMILSQFIMSMCDYVLKHNKVNVKQFAEMSAICVDQAYRVVNNPIEGTILSVMKEWQRAVREIAVNQWQSLDLVSLLEASLVTVSLSLEKTKQQLPVLRKLNVVDAGAKGFFHLLQGFTEGLSQQRDQPEDDSRENEIIAAAVLEQSAELEFMNEHEISIDSRLRYCAEFLIEHDKQMEASTIHIEQSPIDLNKRNHLKQILELFGDSIVMVGDEHYTKLHMHTNDPSEVAEMLTAFGKLTYQKVDDMQRQLEMKRHNKPTIALVVDSACDLPQEFIDQYEIHMLPLTVMIDQSSYLDKLTLLPKQFYRHLQDESTSVSTSMPDRSIVEAMYKRLLDHYEHVIVLTVSERLSGTYHACVQIAEQLNAERIHVINSKTLSGAYGMLALSIAKFIWNDLPNLEGEKIPLVKQKIGELAAKQEILVTVPSLKSMIRSGRVTPFKGFLASVLKVKPIVTVDEHGAAKLLKPALFGNSNIPAMLKHLKKIQEVNPIQQYVILYTDQQSEVAYLEREMLRITGINPSYITTVSSVIGTHAGSGAFSIAIMLTNQIERSSMS